FPPSHFGLGGLPSLVKVSSPGVALYSSEHDNPDAPADLRALGHSYSTVGKGIDDIYAGEIEELKLDTKYVPHSNCAYRLSRLSVWLFGGVPAAIGECTFGLFSYKYAGIGIKIVIGAMGGDPNSLASDVVAYCVGIPAAAA